ncbi:MAG: FKBP-type peptidyl-prolyl cis-trans isomerase [Longimicrobiales bacterium]
MTALVLVLAGACGGQDAPPPADEPPAAAAAPTQTCATPVPGAPAGVTVAQEYAPALGVDLAQMTRTDSGLCYQDMQEGTGEVAAAGDSVAVHYTGWLPDGTKFDSSVDRGDPIRFPIGMREVIRGWDEGIVGLKQGAKRKLVIPYDLAYGPEGRPPIPPNATLVFDVELVEVKK